LLLPDDPLGRSQEQVGGKAKSLVSLRAAGFDVPDFCVVACRAFLELHRTQNTAPLRAPLTEWLSTHPAGTGFAVRSSARGEDSLEN
jgi:hypothetical protein